MGAYDPEPFLDAELQKLLLQGLLSALPSYVACIDRERRLLFANRTATRDLSEMVGKPIERYVAEPHQSRVVACIELAFSMGERQVIHFDAVTADGSVRQTTAEVHPLTGPAGQSVALLLLTDETERQRHPTELQRSEAFRRRVMENLPDYVSILDREHRFVWVNRVAPGLNIADVLGVKIESFLAPGSVAPTSAAIDATFATGVAGQCETEGYGDERSTRWVLNRTVPLELGGKLDAVLLITSDISQLKRAEQALRDKDKQLQHAQHLESIGQLAGGIAHDFNNLLQVIDGNLHFAREGIAHGEDVHEELEQALHATRAAADLTSRLLAVGRRKRLAPARVDLGALTSGNLRMLRAAIPENVNIRFQPSAVPCIVDVDAREFEQVLINLCVNARDAMPKGGTLQIGIEPDGADHVVLSVADDGVGIREEDLTRVFEPFFSTKQRAAGLGLAVVAGIIAAHGGTVSAESNEASGTTMRVRLPRAKSEPRPARSTRQTSRAAPRTILLAEDEPLVRAQVVRILEGAGHHVLAAEDGLRAIELFQTASDAIDLLVLDAIMPHCDGWRAYVEIERLKPGIKALFTTGYAANVLPSDFSSRGAALLSKPFKPADLLAKVSAMLASPPREEEPVVSQP